MEPDALSASRSALLRALVMRQVSQAERAARVEIIAIHAATIGYVTIAFELASAAEHAWGWNSTAVFVGLFMVGPSLISAATGSLQRRLLVLGYLHRQTGRWWSRSRIVILNWTTLISAGKAYMNGYDTNARTFEFLLAHWKATE
jgi:hypothetical protein